jgi:transcriptional regulator with XRE-family HTH domain
MIGILARGIFVGDSAEVVPTRRTTVQKSKLPPKEQAICLRLKEARLRLGLSQESVAQRVGVLASQISNLEKCRAPVRCQFALRFCRELIISEEWLATGKFAGAEAALGKDQPVRPPANAFAHLRPLLFRQCADLFSHPYGRGVPERTLFSDAYALSLAQAYYMACSDARPGSPRIETTNYDRPDFEMEITTVRIERLLFFIRMANGDTEEAAKNAVSHFAEALREAAETIADEVLLRDWKADIS